MRMTGLYLLAVIINTSSKLADGANALSAAIDKAIDSRIDELVFGKLKEPGIPLSEICSDEVFVRRAFIAVIGTLPTAREGDLQRQHILKIDCRRKRTFL